MNCYIQFKDSELILVGKVQKITIESFKPTYYYRYLDMRFVKGDFATITDLILKPMDHPYEKPIGIWDGNTVVNRNGKSIDLKII